MIKRKAAALLSAGLFAASSAFTSYAEASGLIESGETLELIPGDTKGLTMISEPESEVAFNDDISYTGWIGYQNGGVWLIGGDNGDTGISFDTLKSYDYFEIDYEYELVKLDDEENYENTEIEGLMIGPIFKIRIKDRYADDGGPVFYDYLPQMWVGSGPDGRDGRGLTMDALEGIYRTQVKTQGCISIPTSELAEIFEEDSDYLMGVGFGTDNETYLDKNGIGKNRSYNITITAIRLTNTQSDKAGFNYLKGEPADEAEQSQPEETAAETSAAVTEDTEQTAAQTERANQTTAAPAQAVSTENNSSGSLTVILIAAVAVIVAVVVVLIIMLIKKKK